MIPLWMYTTAITCGNTYVMKPSERVPNTSVRLIELLEEAGCPPGVVNVVHGGSDTVTHICQDPDIKAVSFVGGNQAGEYIWREGTKHGKRVQSNMGAKNHAIVLPDADKEDTLNALTAACFGSRTRKRTVLTISRTSASPRCSPTGSSSVTSAVPSNTTYWPSALSLRTRPHAPVATGHAIDELYTSMHASSSAPTDLRQCTPG